MDKSPDAFRTISEVADALETPAHVLRFWESRFPQIRPVKRAGGRRYYRPADVALLMGIKHLLHDEGMTIRGVQKILREQGVRHVSGVMDEVSSADDDAALEAALAASGGIESDVEPLPPAEAETAQIIALESALDQAPAPRAMDADQAPLNEDDLFARLARDAAPEAKPPEKLKPEESLPSKEVAATPSSKDSSVVASKAPTEPEADEAPMEVWAEAEAPPQPETGSGAGALKITRIGASVPDAPGPSNAPLSPQDTLQDGISAGIARRLRATRVGDLSASDRATLSILRAKARSLRDRLANQTRASL